MKIQLIGFNYNLRMNKRLKIFVDIINKSNADLILFPGHTLRNEDDIDRVCKDITNTRPSVVFELKDADPTGFMHTNNELYLYKDGVFYDTYSNQHFATAQQIKNNEMLMGKLFDELPRRTLTISGKRITILQCGETSLLECKRDNDNQAEFRFADNELLNARYNEMLNSTDIFLNPIHLAQGGRQWLYNPKRITLSSNNRYYLSTSSLDKKAQGKLESKRIQYVYHNGEQVLVEPEISSDKSYVSRIIYIE